jgi:EpsD family peptidyl-prolyl cis-trans isomerase
MKRMLLLSLAALALPLAAQQTPPPAAAAPPPAPKQAAIVNGEVISVDRLEQMWSNMSTAFRDQYEANGGKQAFLENYLRKRLVIQEAIKSGFDKRPDVVTDMDAARESALFDRYIRDVVALPYVSEADIKKYYDEHPSEFPTPERIHVRHIVIAAPASGPAAKTKEQALERIKAIAADVLKQSLDLRASQSETAADRLRLIYFSDAARKYSEDASASSGGDLGWKAKGDLDPAFEEAAWSMKPGMISGIVETRYGYHLIMVEEHQPAGTQPYETVRPAVREYLLTQKAQDVMTAVNKLTNELRMTSKVTLFPENIK